MEQKLQFNMLVITPMGEGRIQGQVARSDPPKMFVRILVDDLPPEMRTALQARHLTCVMLEFDPDELVPVIAGRKVTKTAKR